MWDAVKVFEENCTTYLNVYIIKPEWSKINHLSFHLRKKEKEEKIKVQWRKAIR